MHCLNNGWFSGVAHAPSPHFNQRPEGVEIDCLVIHSISLPVGVFGNGNIAALFTHQLDCTQHASFDSLKDLKVSSHFVIDREGLITQYVSCLDRAWHAGASSLNGRENCNDFSIGIELEGSDFVAFTDLQYPALTQLTQQLLIRFPSITPERIVGHCDIAPTRKTDPGPFFDWSLFRGSLCRSAQ